MDKLLEDLEKIKICQNCAENYDNNVRIPKILPCQHCVCLKCVLSQIEQENFLENFQSCNIYCPYCFNKFIINSDVTLLPNNTTLLNYTVNFEDIKKGLMYILQDEKKVIQPCPKHEISSNRIWCYNCKVKICDFCLLENGFHINHELDEENAAIQTLSKEIENELKQSEGLIDSTLSMYSEQEKFLSNIFKSVLNLKDVIEKNIQNSVTSITEMKKCKQQIENMSAYINDDAKSIDDINRIYNETNRLRNKLIKIEKYIKRHSDLMRIITNSRYLHTFQTLSQILAEKEFKNFENINENVDSLLLITNFCVSRLYAKYYNQNNLTGTMLKTNFPLYYLEIQVDGLNFGKIIIETRPDVAPKMSKNFELLVTNQVLGASYVNCKIFQCWINQSIITGDYEFNDGQGGKGILNGIVDYFQPDESKLEPIRGAVGMRRNPKNKDYLGQVGSQFRIILNNVQSFSGIFARVVDGLTVVEKISSLGDSTGKPLRHVVISSCGKFN